MKTVSTKIAQKKLVRGDYDSVVQIVSAGHPYNGRLGYYDDDEGNKAIVHLGSPFKDGIKSIRIKLSALRYATTQQDRAWRKKTFGDVNPELMAMTGISPAPITPREIQASASKLSKKPINPTVD